MKHLFEKPIEILRKIHNHGYEAYIVGGAVRDYILQKPIHDIDIATSATPLEVQQMFPVTIPVGIEHGTVIVRYKSESYEVTTFRKESKYEDFRHPSEVIFVHSLIEDLQRRDFTMNALALTYDEHVIDPFNGQEDLKNHILRTVGEPTERFSEDPLRMMRAFRFISQLNLSVDSKTRHAITQLSHLIQNIAMERLLNEFDKLLMGRSVRHGLAEMGATGFIRQLPYFDIEEDRLKKMIDCPFLHLYTLEERWTLLILILEKQCDDVFYKTWRFPRRRQKKIKQLFKIYQEMSNKRWTPYLLYRYGIADASSATRILATFGNLHKLDDVNKLTNLYQTLPIKQRTDLEVNGADLVKWTEQSPGPWVNQLLDEIESRIVNRDLINDKKEIRRWVNVWLHSNKNY